MNRFGRVRIHQNVQSNVEYRTLAMTHSLHDHVITMLKTQFFGKVLHCIKKIRNFCKFSVEKHILGWETGIIWRK